MTLKNNFTRTAAIVALMIAVTGCSDLTRRDKNTIIGASIGAAAGAVLTGGSGIGTAGGAAIGGVIGHQVGKYK